MLPGEIRALSYIADSDFALEWMCASEVRVFA